MKNNNTYILSLEASDIYGHMFRGKNIKDSFSGMIPYSLELIKLKSIGFKYKTTKTNKINGKETSRDIINVKFNFKVQDAKTIISKIKKKIKKDEIRLDKEHKNLKELNMLDTKLPDIKRKIDKCTKKNDGLKNKISYLNNIIKCLEKQIEIYKEYKDIVYTRYYQNFNIVKITKISKNKKKFIELIKLKRYKVARRIQKYNIWDEMSNQVLREYLYKNGFIITTIKQYKNKKGELISNVKEDHYRVYKRSSSKSRTGQCLFIKDNLYQPMIDWARMYLPFIEGMELDYASLLAYESLVGSSLEGTIKINPKNILIVKDVPSEFKHRCNVIRKDNITGLLNSFNEEYEVNNSLFDGESLLSSEIFPEGQSMILLRQHMFKSASFNCNIQQYLKDHCPEGMEFDKWKINNMFGQPILAKDIQMIFCPTSLKALKFDKDLDITQKEIWEHWKKIIKKEKCIFGICKHEKPSKRGKDELGNILQQTSYQMLNSLKANLDDITELAQFELDYIKKLKNDDQFFIDYAIENSNEINSNLMFGEIAKRNIDFVSTEMFRIFRAREINDHVSHCKKGKIRLSGDYCVLLGNGLEFLSHAIGKFDIDTVDVNTLPLKENEIFTKLHDFNTELTCFRNPHTSPSNVLVAKNKYVEEIGKYFNLSSNIVCVNAIKFPIQDIFSSMDYDSDSIAIFKSEKLLEVAKRCYKKYDVCVNDITSDKRPYKLTSTDMCKIDNRLANSQRNIGEVVNLGQWCLSAYWDHLKKGKTVDELSELMKSVDIMTILSGVCIDLAKKFYLININDEIENVKKTELLGKSRPIFSKFIIGKGRKVKSKKQEIKNKNKLIEKARFFHCPMDYLNTRMSNLDYADGHKNIELNSLLEEMNNKADWGQEQKVIDYVNNMVSELNYINAKNSGDKDYEIEEKNNQIDDVIKYYKYYMNKLTVNRDTMISILNHMIQYNQTDIQVKLLNILFTTQKKTFLEVFKEKH